MAEYGNGMEGMYGIGDMAGMMVTHGLFGLLVTVLFVVLLIAGIVFLFRAFRGGTAERRAKGGEALDRLDERYARGEIGREEYLEKKKDLSA